MAAAIHLLAAFWLGTATPAAAPTPALLQTAAETTPDFKKDEKRFGEVARLLAAKKFADAISVADTIIADHEKKYRGDKRAIYSARTPTEALLYAGMAAKEKRDATVVGPDWGLAVYIKGYALIDLNLRDEARTWLERAVEMSPMNSQFLGELGEWHKNGRAWDEAYRLFERATAAAEFSPDEFKSDHKRRGMRGMGFVLIEQGDLDRAEALFRKCLEIEPNDRGAKVELDYIKQQRSKARPKTT